MNAQFLRCQCKAHQTEAKELQNKFAFDYGDRGADIFSLSCSVTGGELFEDIVAREYYSEADAR